jgi:hypothetical protein
MITSTVRHSLDGLIGLEQREDAEGEGADGPILQHRAILRLGGIRDGQDGETALKNLRKTRALHISMERTALGH